MGDKRLVAMVLKLATWTAERTAKIEKEGHLWGPLSFYSGNLRPLFVTLSPKTKSKILRNVHSVQELSEVFLKESNSPLCQ